jgi:glycosyltransferase involved in cell wall biosynthesis
MLFSIIIPTYNRYELLRRTLSSVWEQSFVEFEVIVIDDGSADNTWDELRALGSKLRVLRQQNAGPGAARNLGAKHANGDYLAFLDSDDLLFPWSLKTYATIIARHGKPGFLAGCPFRFRTESELKELVPTPLVCQTFSDYLASSDEWRWWGASSFVVRSDLFHAAGGFSEKNVNGEDADLALRLGEAPGFIHIKSPLTCAYREHPANLTLDVDKALAGAWHKIRSERAGEYPGGGARARPRHRILTRHIRPLAIACLTQRRRQAAWALYRETFCWNASLGRLKFLTAFPILAMLAGSRRARCQYTQLEEEPKGH